MDQRPNPSIASLIAAAGLGALVMFVLDPQSGSRRVALARDRTRRLVRESADAVGVGWRDLRNRASGVRHLVQRNSASDRELEARVRAELGRWVSHPHAIEVSARQGDVVLSGSVLAAEQAQLKRAVEGVRGVRCVETHVAAYDSPDGMPALQGGRVHSGPRPPWPLGERHAPATRLLGMSASVSLVAGGLVRRGVPGLLLTAAGLAIAADVATTRRRMHDRGADENAPMQQPDRIAQPRADSALRDMAGHAETATRTTPRAPV